MIEERYRSAMWMFAALNGDNLERLSHRRINVQEVYKIIDLRVARVALATSRYD